jgi:hypothetical protein
MGNPATPAPAQSAKDAIAAIKDLASKIALHSNNSQMVRTLAGELKAKTTALEAAITLPAKPAALAAPAKPAAAASAAPAAPAAKAGS